MSPLVFKKNKKDLGTGLKILIGVAAVGAIALVAKTKKAIDNFTFNIIGYDTPKIKNWVLTVPLVMEFNNPFFITIPVKQFRADFFLLMKNNWQQIGTVDQMFAIEPGITRKTITPNLDLKSFFNDNFIFTLDSFLKTQSVKLRADIRITTVSGVTITDSQTMDLSIDSI